MRIVIDVQGLQGGSQQRGIGRYCKSFIEAFIRQSIGHEIYLFINMLLPHATEIQEAYASIVPKKNIVPFYGVGPVREVYPSNLWNLHTSELIREKMLLDLNADFVIITSLFEGLTDNSIISIGKYSTIPTATILYDLIPLIYPDKFLTNPLKKLWYDRKLNSLKKSDILLSISYSASQEALEYLDFSSEHIYNISAASDIIYKETLSSKKVKPEYLIAKPFLLHASAYEPRKNFEGLIYAFAKLDPVIRKQYQLVLVCKLKDKQRQSLEKIIKITKLQKNEVILTGYVDDEMLISLYHTCHLFVFPSLHEGFGLPPLEAMLCGAATIGSNTSSIPEVIGLEEALFDPYSRKSITDKISEVLTQKSFWENLKVHAKKQASFFSWENTAKKALNAIEHHHKKYPYNKPSRTPKKSTQTLIQKIASQTIKNIRPLDVSLFQAAQAITQNEATINQLINNEKNKPCWRVEGPFDSSYSLALLNRETALALTSLGYEVLLHSSDGPGDFTPNKDFLTQHPFIEILYRNTFTLAQKTCAISSRNLYPPRVSDMQTPSKMLHHYAWEESGFPRQWVENFNTHLTSMTCLSSHVKKILIDNGVSTPMLTSGCGVDHWERIVPDMHYNIKAKTFKFLHVSSCFPRKGVDILLKAYADSFTQDDDVTLIIKTFKNPHNEIENYLQEVQKEHHSFPDVQILYEDLSDAHLKALYEYCDVLVAPSRAEGFGLPMAEAMLSGLAVITTAWGGQLDFCTVKTSWLIDYAFTPAQTHFKLYDSVWAEPSQSHLTTLMKELYLLPKIARQKRSLIGRTQLLKDFKWIDVTQRLVAASKDLSKDTNSVNIAWVSTWQSKCGIASYSEHLVGAFTSKLSILANHEETLLKDDALHVHRCWQAGDGNTLDTLMQTIEHLSIDTLVIQFNYSFFDFDAFKLFIETMDKQGKVIILMLHATVDSPLTPHKKLHMLGSSFALCERLLVHTPNDLNRLKALGLVENVTLFPHAVVDFSKPYSRASTTFTLASYGFFLPHKGLLELIEAVHILHTQGLNIKLHMVNALYPVEVSQTLYKQAKENIKKHALENVVTLTTDYLEDDISLTHLSQADLLVFPYQETGESSSAAVRYGLASHSPVAVTPLDIFNDVKSASHLLSGTSPEEMAESLTQLIHDISTQSDIAKKKKKEAHYWVEAHLYAHVGKRLENMIQALGYKYKPDPVT